MRANGGRGGNAMTARKFYLIPFLGRSLLSLMTDLSFLLPLDISGTSLDSQKRYADGTIEILDNWVNGKAQTPANIIVENGD